MMYLTDYSGLGSWAASLGSALLVFARIFDAINDPFEAWIMDNDILEDLVQEKKCALQL